MTSLEHVLVAKFMLAALLDRLLIVVGYRRIIVELSIAKTTKPNGFAKLFEVLELRIYTECRY